MHQPKAIGLGVELVREGNVHWLKSRIVEPTAARLAVEKVLQAYSVGIANAKIDYAKNPKARGGTIVGGDFVEVSLVDRPANAACKVDLVKAAKDGTAEFTDVLTKAPEVDADGADDPVSEAVQKVWSAEGVVYKKDYSAEERRRLAKEGKALPDGSYPIENETDLHNAAVLARSGHGDAAAAKRLIARRAKELGVPNPLKEKAEKGKVPDVDEEVTDDLEHADEAIHEAQEAQHEDNEHHREGDDDDDDDAEKSVAPYTLKRLHDHLCAAYGAEALAEEYPTCPTLKDALDPGYWAKAVGAALSEDAGSGKHAGLIADLSEAYGCAVGVAHADDAAVADARMALHKAFSSMYPSVTVKPSAVVPGRFRRPFISSGRAQMHAGRRPRLPMQAHVPDAEQFDRGYISAGHAANSPSAHGPNGPRAEKSGKKGRQFYTNNARDQAMQAMTALHDYIVSTHPEICAMKADADVAEPAPINPDHRVDNEAHAAPKPVATKTITLEDGEVNVADLQKMVVKATRKATRKLEKEQAKLLKKHAKTVESLKALQQQADPGAMAYRGGYIGPNVTKAATSEPVDPAEGAKRDQIAWLKGQVRHSDPTVSRPALEKLQSLVSSPDELADILTGA